MNRRLNKYESLLWLMGRDEPWLIQWTLILSGKINKADVEQALKLVQSQHPLLNHAISPSKPFEFIPITTPIRLTIHPLKDENTWRTYAEEILGKVLPLSEHEPFLTLDWVTDGENHEFIFAMDHAFCDFRCVTGIGCDFLAILDQIMSGTKNIQVKHYPFLPPFDTLLPTDKTAAQTPAVQAVWGDTLPLVAEPPYRPRLPVVYELSEEQTQQIIRTARNQKCSVQGLICAAMTYALNNYGIKHQRLDEATFCFTPGDTRSYLNKNISTKELGNFTSPIFHPFIVGQLPAFTTLAREITQQIKISINTDGFSNGARGFATYYNENLTSAEVLRTTKIRDFAGSVSNVGVLPVQDHYQHFKLHKVRAGSASGLMSGRGNLFWLGVETLYGKMQLEFLRTHPIEEKDYMPQFAKEVMDILKEFEIIS